MVTVKADPVLDTATVQVNGRYLEGSRDYYHTFSDTLDPVPNIDYALLVKTDIGDADASCRMPGDFAFANLPDSVALNAAVTLNWDSPAGASWTDVRVMLDTSLMGSSPLRETSCVVSPGQTSFTIPIGWLNDSGVAIVYVMAHDGPKRQAGSRGNVNNAAGFWTASNGLEGMFLVGHVLELTRYTRLRRQPEEILRSWLSVSVGDQAKESEAVAHPRWLSVTRPGRR
jgi:hypothetical protein